MDDKNRKRAYGADEQVVQLEENVSIGTTHTTCDVLSIVCSTTALPKPSGNYMAECQPGLSTEQVARFHIQY